MDELVKIVSEKTGLSQEMSEKAVEAVVGYLSKELPDPFGGIVDKFLAGDKDFGLDDIAGNLKDVFKFP